MIKLKPNNIMKHRIATIAADHLVNAQQLKRFALTYHNKYGVRIYNCQANITTFFVNKLIEDFKALPAEKFGSKFLQNVDLYELNVDGWRFYDDPHSGSIGWSHPEYQNVTIYATPNWDEEGTIPFALHNEQHEDRMPLAELKLFKDSPIELQLEMYVAVLRSIIKTL